MSVPGTMLQRVAVVGTGSYVPQRIVTNADLERFLDTSDEWILSRTGMRERRIAADDEATSDLGARAALRALEDAGVPPEEVDLIVAPTITPDVPWPNTGCLIQDKIGAVNAYCMGLEAACTGFVYGMDVAGNALAVGSAKTALVVGAEKMSSILDWEDRNTCVLFGDGAGAVLLRGGVENNGLIASAMGSDGSLSGLLQVPAGGSRLPASEETVRQRLHYLKMNGREVFKHAVGNMARAAHRVLKKANVTIDEVDWIIPHQANLRIIQSVIQKLNAPMNRVVVNIEYYGNTSGASIGLALDEAVKDGRIRHGHKVLLIAFGGGFTWGALLLEWTK